MKLSSKSQYGLKACYILALNYEKRSFSASALEKEIGVSGKYLERILRMLSGARIVAAERGVSGGYRLARNPAKITVGDIVRVKVVDVNTEAKRISLSLREVLEDEALDSVPDDEYEISEVSIDEGDKVIDIIDTEA